MRERQEKNAIEEKRAMPVVMDINAALMHWCTELRVPNSSKCRTMCGTVAEEYVYVRGVVNSSNVCAWTRRRDPMLEVVHRNSNE